MDGNSHSLRVPPGIILLALLGIAVIFLSGLSLIADVSAASPELTDDTGSGAKPDCHFGVFPHLTPRRLAAAYAPVTQKFSERLGRECHFSTKSTFTGFSAALRAQAYDISLIQAFDYAAAFEMGKYLPLAFSKDQVKAIFVVHRDSGVRRLEDLRGKAIGLPPAQAVASVLALPMLTELGITIGEGSDLRHYRNHNACLHAVLIRKIFSCVTAPVPLRSFQVHGSDRLQRIAESTAKPGALFVVHGKMPPQDREAVLQEILSWDDGDEARRHLRRMGRAKGFVSIEEASPEMRDTLKRPVSTD